MQRASARNVYTLGPWEEAFGLLTNVDEENNQLIFQNFVLNIQPEKFDAIKHIRGLVGEKVAILRTDMKETAYLVFTPFASDYSKSWNCR
jgi:hypothetical protein